MGQFQSKEYDGDPYVDLMRALPERELIWWVQKVIWLVEGYTFLDHFWRTYPNMFIHKCKNCNGTGAMTCRHCHGYKLRQGSGPGAMKLTDMSPESARALLQAGSAGNAVDCQHCGTYCSWDHESEWEEKWEGWEKKLAYYDRTYGELMNEWYEDVLHEGNLDEDTPHEDGPPPSPQETGPIAQYDRQKRKYPELIQALMQRYGGHPYETMDMLPFNVVDPVKKTPLENLWFMGHNRNELPPELHPYNFPELLVLPMSPLKELDNEIRMEALLCRNLDSALQDSRKPYVFEPTAGTVPCSACGGVPWTAHWMPNLGKIFHVEVPMWQRVLGRMSRFATQPRRLADAESRHFLEYPQQDASVGVLQDVLVQELEGPPGPQQVQGAKGRAVNKGARASLVGGMDSSKDQGYLNAWGVRGLSRDNMSSGPDEYGQQVRLSTGSHPVGNVAGPLARAVSSSSSVNGRPDKAAAFIQDVTRLRQAHGTVAEEQVVQQLQQRYSPAAVQAMLHADSTKASGGRSRSTRSSGGPEVSEAALVAECPTAVSGDSRRKQ